MKEKAKQEENTHSKKEAKKANKRCSEMKTKMKNLCNRMKKSIYGRNVPKCGSDIFYSSLMDLSFIIMLFIVFIFTGIVTEEMTGSLLTDMDNYSANISTIYGFILFAYVIGVFLWSISRSLSYRFLFKTKFSFNKILIHFSTTVGALILLTLIFMLTQKVFLKDAAAIVNSIVLLLSINIYLVFSSLIFSTAKIKDAFKKSIKLKNNLPVIASIIMSYGAVLIMGSFLDYILSALNYTNNFTTDIIKSFLLLVFLLVGISWSRKYVSNLAYERNEINTKKIKN